MAGIEPVEPAAITGARAPPARTSRSVSRRISAHPDAPPVVGAVELDEGRRPGKRRPFLRKFNVTCHQPREAVGDKLG